MLIVLRSSILVADFSTLQYLVNLGWEVLYEEYEEIYFKVNLCPVFIGGHAYRRTIVADGNLRRRLHGHHVAHGTARVPPSVLRNISDSSTKLSTRMDSSS